MMFFIISTTILIAVLYLLGKANAACERYLEKINSGPWRIEIVQDGKTVFSEEAVMTPEQMHAKTDRLWQSFSEKGPCEARARRTDFPEEAYAD